MTDASGMLTPGTRLAELEIERVLGAGGFGVTYLARDLSLDARRALKEYLPRDWGTRRGDGTVGPRSGSDAADYQWGLERFLSEARLLARFRHEQIVHVYRVLEARGTAYMVMEYVAGRTLQQELEASGPLPEARVWEVLALLTEGLSVVHGSALLHRDIKPGNVMVRPDGRPVLIDFGSARQLVGGHSRSLTAVVTPGYAPIEQYSASGHQGPWTDIYALGAVAYWALSGKAPAEAVVFHAIPPEFTKLFREARLRISHVDPLLQERNGCKRTRKLHAIRRLPGSRFCLPFQIRPISQPFRDGGIWYKSDEKKLETTKRPNGCGWTGCCRCRRRCGCG